MLRALLISLLVALACAGSAFAGRVDDGAATYTFRRSPFNAYGLVKLEELRGKPVLIEFWGTR